ncbi:lysozyme inhibitor LprI family protein [Candidatus Parabeggiatoa sp. HSG14]|uniref:lysozyme inhibitor LprI family protein n=1 Tax=Candidatus Parabeggiatoa sp. HSG14 TaxID=3055593 RepID=UPI0025A89DD2|nr:DUF1311 domain-containing protein [Thiotrichales bacterium HSG14]
MSKKAILWNVSSVLVAISLSLTMAVSVAQEKHPIDNLEEACLDKSNITVDMMNCHNQAYEMWDSELNQVYKSLMKKLDKPGKKVLRNAQRAWLKYRDAEMETIDAVYGLLQGSMWIPIALSKKADITKERALTLKGYLNNLELGQ